MLTISTSSFRGLPGASIYNIISSNIINLIQYFVAIVLNKNGEKLKNNAIKTDIILVVTTILIPIAILKIRLELNINIVPLFIILYVFFRFLNSNAHRQYLKNDEETFQIENKKSKVSYMQIIKNVLILIVTGILLFLDSKFLGNTLENLCNLFKIPELIIGILLGFTTSIPELITFFEAQRHHQKLEDNMIGVVEATNNLLTSNTINLFVVQTIAIVFTVNR